MLRNGVASVQNVWDESHLRALGSVRSEANRNNKAIHIGRLFDVCLEKHNELAAHMRKNKGPLVFCSNVRDGFALAAMFQGQGSGVSYATAFKILGAASLLQGC